MSFSTRGGNGTSGIELDENADLLLSGLLKIGFVFSVIAIITYLVTAFYQRAYISQHINEYKCKPFIMPFVNHFDASIDTVKNFEACMKANTSKFFSSVSQPLLNVTQSTTDSVTQAAATVAVLSDGVSHVGEATSAKVQESNLQLSEHQGIFFYLVLKMKAFFDKTGALLNDAYSALQSTMDVTNVLLALPEILMKIFGFMVMMFVIVVVLLIVQFILNYVLGISLFAIGTSLIPTVLLQPLGFVLQASGLYYMNAIAIAIYASAVAMTTIFLGVMLSMYVPLKTKFEQADKSSYCCFSKDTNIRVSPLQFKPMDQFKVGQEIFNQNKVLGFLHAMTKEQDWYSVKRKHVSNESDMVCSNHLIFDSLKNKFVTVQSLAETINHAAVAQGRQSQLSLEKVTDRGLSSTIEHRCSAGKFCLVTSNHTIQTCNAEYRDYQEVEEKSNEMVKLVEDVLKQRNGSLFNVPTIEKMHENGEIGLGFAEFVQVQLANLDFIRIADIKIHTMLLGENEVLGIYKCLFAGSRCSIFPAHQIVWDDTEKSWKKAYSLFTENESSIFSNAREVYLEQDCLLIGYHLVTEKGSFVVRGGMGEKKYSVLDFVTNGSILKNST